MKKFNLKKFKQQRTIVIGVLETKEKIFDDETNGDIRDVHDRVIESMRHTLLNINISQNQIVDNVNRECDRIRLSSLIDTLVKISKIYHQLKQEKDKSKWKFCLCDCEKCDVKFCVKPKTREDKWKDRENCQPLV